MQIYDIREHLIQVRFSGTIRYIQGNAVHLCNGPHLAFNQVKCSQHSFWIDNNLFEDDFVLVNHIREFLKFISLILASYGMEVTAIADLNYQHQDVDV